MPDRKDDYPDDMSIFGVIDGYKSVTGNFEIGYDLDWFSSKLEGGKRYLISLFLPGQKIGSEISSALVAMAIFNSQGEQVFELLRGSQYQKLIIDFLPSATDTYFIAAKSLYYWDGLGTYQISVEPLEIVDCILDTTTSTAYFPLDKHLVGTFEYGGDRDWFKFEAKEGIHYQFYYSSSALGIPSEFIKPSHLRVHDSKGALMPLRVDSFDPARSGDYFVELIGFDVGTYDVWVEQILDDYSDTNLTKGLIAPGDSIKASMDYPRDHDAFKLPLAENRFYTIRLSSPHPYFGLEVYTEDRELVSYTSALLVDGITELTLHTLEATTLILDVRLGLTEIIPKTPISYNVNLSKGIRDDHSDILSRATALFLESRQQGILEASGDIDSFKIHLVAGKTYGFQLQAPISKIRFIDFLLINDQGKTLVPGDAQSGLSSFNLGSDQWLTYTAPSDMTISLIAKSMIAGAHNYTIMPVDLSSDHVAPTLLSSSIAPFAKNVPLTTRVISFDLSEDAIVDKTKITLTNSKGEQVFFTYSSLNNYNDDFLIDGSTLKFKLSRPLEPETYTFRFASSAIQDFAGNKYVGPQTLTFSTAQYVEVGTQDDDYFILHNDTLDGGAGYDSAITTDIRQFYSLQRTADGITVRDTLSNSVTSLKDIEKLQFGNCNVRLDIAQLSKTIPPSDLKNIQELYIAFFNRLPDAEGLAYWISNRASGASINEIAGNFYQAAIAFSKLTGYAENMNAEAFVRVIYGNVLSRKADLAPPDEDVSYWANKLNRHEVSKGELVNIMLYSAHSFKGDSTWGWVADLLDNRVEVSNYFAVQQGLSFNSAEENIVNCSNLLSAITPTSSSEAIRLIGINDPAWLS